MDTGSAETLVLPSPSPAVLMAPGGSADWSLMAPFDRGVAGWARQGQKSWPLWPQCPAQGSLRQDPVGKYIPDSIASFPPKFM